jgi:hypothetical protein
MSKKFSSIVAITALINNCEALQLKDLVTFKLPDESSLVYDDEVSDSHPQIELIVSEFGGVPGSKSAGTHKHHHHQKIDTQVKAENPEQMAQVGHPEQMSDDQEKNAVKNDLAALQKNMD